MITDRRRLGAGWERSLPERVAAAAKAGTHLIQIREPDLDGRGFTRLVERCMTAMRGTAARLLVNDRLDVALAAGAHGVHLRADSMPAAAVRAIAPPGFLVGRSVHSRPDAETAVRAGGLDYLIFGTVFESASKPGRPAAGPRALADVASATGLPVLAVGGVTANRAAQLGGSGAAGFAAIGLFVDGAVEVLHDTIAKTAQAFDTPGGVP
jgi:thiamine-phosphate pyrophosphorylase